MFERIANWTLDHRGLATALLLVLVLGMAGGAARLRVEMSVETFFGGDDPERVHLEEYRAFWGADDDVLIVVVSADDGDLLSPERMRAIGEAGDALAAVEGVTSVDSIASAPRLRSDLPGTIDLQPLLDSMPDAGSPAWRAEVLSHPLFIPALLSKDGRTAAIFVETFARSDDMAAVVPLVAALRSVLAEREGQAGLHFGTAGMPAVRADFFSSFMRDQGLFIPLGMLFIGACLFFIFRRVHGVVIPAFAAAVPVMMVFGALGLTGEPLGLVNQVYVTLLPVIAVADSIHLLSRYHEEARRLAPPGEVLSDALRRQAIVAAVKRIGAACLLTSVTTGLGFASLAAAEMPSMRSFGLYAALGVAFAYGTVLLMLPLMLSVTRGAASDARSGPGLIDRTLARCAAFSIRRPKPVLAATAVTVVLCLFFGTRVVSDNHLTHMLLDDHPTTQANLLADRELGGILAVEVDLKGEAGVLKDPAVLTALRAVETEALTWPEVTAISSPATYIAGLGEVLTGERTIPATRAEIAQRFLLGEGDEKLGTIVSIDYARGRLAVRTKDDGGIVFGQVSARLRALLDRELGEVPLTAHITGTPFIAYRGINRVTADLRSSILLAFVTITLVILLLLRDLRLTALCLLPNALPLLVGYGLVGATGWLLDPTGAVIFTVALGIAVDDTLHLVARMREELDHGHPLEEALRLSVLHSGRAVFITSVLLMGGFGMNLLSSFPASQLMGGLGTIIVAAALVCDVLVLPALLSQFARRPQVA